MSSVKTAAIAGLLLLGGCMTSQKGLDLSDIRLTEGKTTFAETIAQCGNPDSIKGDEAIWNMRLSKGGQVKLAYMKVGVTCSSVHLATREYRLTFDKRGVLQKIRTFDSIPEGAKWGLFPWY